MQHWKHLADVALDAIAYVGIAMVWAALFFCLTVDMWK